MGGKEKQVPEEVLPAEDSVQAMGEADGLENANSFSCLLCGDQLKCTEADSSVYMEHLRVDHRVTMFDPALLVKVVQQIVQTATRGETKKRKTTEEESEKGKCCKRKKVGGDKKARIVRTAKEDGCLQEIANDSNKASHLAKEVWVTSLTETRQRKPKWDTTKVSIEMGKEKKATISEQEDLGLEEGQVSSENTIEKDMENTMELEEEADQIHGGLDLLFKEEEVPEIDDEFCVHLVPEIEDEFWDGSIRTHTKSSPTRKGDTTWIDSFGIPCNLCAPKSNNKSDFKKHIQADHGLSLIQYRSRYGPAGPRQKFKCEICGEGRAWTKKGNSSSSSSSPLSQSRILQSTLWEVWFGEDQKMYNSHCC